MARRAAAPRPGRMPALLPWFLVVLGFLAACSGSGERSGTQGSGAVSSSPSAAAPEGASVDGFLVRPSGGELSLGPASTSGSPVPMASVTVEDRVGQVLATGSTDRQGYFRFDGLPAGLLRLDFRLMAQRGTAPRDQDPDLTVSVTSFPGAFFHLGQPWPVSRAQAASLALDGRADVLAAESMTPLPAGTTVATVPPDADLPQDLRTLAGEEWFLLLDPTPGQLFSHDVQFVFVDARTGQVTRSDQVFYPTVNGTILWSSTLSLFDMDPSGLMGTPTEEVVAVPPEVASAMARTAGRTVQPVPARHNDGTDGLFVLVIRNDLDSAMVNNATLLRETFLGAGISRDDQYEELAMPLLTIDEGRVALKRFVGFLNQGIEERLARGLHSTLVVYMTSHNVGITPGFTPINLDEGQFIPGSLPPDNRYAARSIFLDDVGLLQTRACRVRFILDMCHAEKFGRALLDMYQRNGTNQDLRIYCACGADELSRASALGIDFLDHPTYFTNAVIQSGRFEDGDYDLATLDSQGNLVLAEGLRDLSSSPIFGGGPQHPVLLTRPSKDLDHLEAAGSLALAVGGRVRLQGADASGNLINSDELTWTSANESVATVTMEGVVTGVSAGQATVTARQECSGNTASATVSVEGLTLVPATASVTVGSTVTLVCQDASGNTIPSATLTWSSSDGSVATVASGVVTGVMVGQATITATEASTGRSASASVRVTRDRLELAPNPIAVFFQRQCVYTAPGEGVVSPSELTYQSSDTTVARVATDGVVTALGEGMATITASRASTGGSGSFTLTVVAPQGITYLLDCGQSSGGPNTRSWQQSLSGSDLTVQVQGGSLSGPLDPESFVGDGKRHFLISGNVDGRTWSLDGFLIITSDGRLGFGTMTQSDGSGPCISEDFVLR